MANTNQAIGAMPAERLYPMQEYTAAGIIYPGDFVMLESGGRVIVATATQALIGVAVSYASAAGQKVLVADHPDQKFVIQSDGATPAVQADIAFNYDITPGSPNSTYRRSSMQLASASKAATATLPLRLVRISKEASNALGANAKCVVVINNHQLKGGTGVAGV